MEPDDDIVQNPIDVDENGEHPAEPFPPAGRDETPAAGLDAGDAAILLCNTGTIVDGAGLVADGVAAVGEGATELISMTGEAVSGAADAAGSVMEGVGGLAEGCASCSVAIVIGVLLMAGTALAFVR